MMNASFQRKVIAVSTRGLALNYGSTRILNGIDLSLDEGRTLALLGPSGCGKTTLLKLVAGLLAPNEGSIHIQGGLVADAIKRTCLPPERRNLGMVFQDYALWPHMSVGNNVSFPLEMRGVAKPERARRIETALRRVGLAGMIDRKPSELSGGQQQRVAIARAIVAEPRIVLFDEPLSNLDRELRENMVDEIAHLVATLGLTAIYVTHDQSEAFTLADQIAIMRSGRIEQLAQPEDLVEAPASIAVAEFLRLGGIAPVERDTEGWRLTGSKIIIAPHFETIVPADTTHVLLPSARLVATPAFNGLLAGRVLRSQFRGNGHTVTIAIEIGKNTLSLQLQSPCKLHPGETIGINIAPHHLRWFSGSSLKDKVLSPC